MVFAVCRTLSSNAFFCKPLSIVVRDSAVVVISPHSLSLSLALSASLASIRLLDISNTLFMGSVTFCPKESTKAVFTLSASCALLSAEASWACFPSSMSMANLFLFLTNAAYTIMMKKKMAAEYIISLFCLFSAASLTISASCISVSAERKRLSVLILAMAFESLASFIAMFSCICNCISFSSSALVILCFASSYSSVALESCSSLVSSHASYSARLYSALLRLTAHSTSQALSMYIG